MTDPRSPRLIKASEAYYKAFNQPHPEPFGIGDDLLARHLERAVQDGQPIGPEHDFYEGLPPEAVV